MKNTKNKKENSSKKSLNTKTKYETNSFLELVKKTIDKIKSTKTKKYSLSSCIFLCFYEKKKKILDKKEICDFIKKEILENNNRIINSNLTIKKTKIHIVTQKNYYLKLYHILLKSKCFTKVINMETNKEEQIELNEEYIHHRKNLIFRHLFGPKFNSEKSSINKKYLKLKRISIIKHKKKRDKKKNDISNDKTNNINQKENSEINHKKEIEKKEESSNKTNSTKEKENEPVKIKKFLRKKRKRTQTINKNNMLVMPLFANSNESPKKIDNKKEDDDNRNINLEEIKEEIISSSFKKIKNIVKIGEEFIVFLKNDKFLNFIKNNDNKNKDIQKLFNSKDDNLLHNFIQVSMEYYLKFNELIGYFLNDKENGYENEDEISNKELNIINYFYKKKNFCILLIFRIISKLFSFILEFNFISEVIDEISSYNKNSNETKYILGTIEKNKIVLNKENIKLLEKLLKNELKNATNSYMIKNGITDD